jgi:hypothetical protein
MGLFSKKVMGRDHSDGEAVFFKGVFLIKGYDGSFV